MAKPETDFPLKYPQRIPTQKYSSSQLKGCACGPEDISLDFAFSKPLYGCKPDLINWLFWGEERKTKAHCADRRSRKQRSPWLFFEKYSPSEMSLWSSPAL